MTVAAAWTAVALSSAALYLQWRAWVRRRREEYECWWLR